MYYSSSQELFTGTFLSQFSLRYYWIFICSHYSWKYFRLSIFITHRNSYKFFKMYFYSWNLLLPFSISLSFCLIAMLRIEPKDLHVRQVFYHWAKSLDFFIIRKTTDFIFQPVNLLVLFRTFRTAAVVGHFLDSGLHGHQSRLCSLLGTLSW
jgi:hypothetical protein